LRKLKLYLDTSTISHLFAEDTPEKMSDTNKFWNDLINDKYEIYISPVVTEELKKCPEPKLSLLFQKLEQIRFDILETTNEVEELAREYINKGVLKEKSHDDCMHIAFAVVYDCDIIVSWNFRHLVNYRTVNEVKIVNAMNRYKEISIISPSMLLEEVD
jgi:predicted nucleic acid-binding protein